MRCLIVAIGTMGDVYPYLGIGYTLQARGHEVIVIANSYFEQKVRELNFGFRSLGTLAEQQAILVDPKLWNPVTVWKVALKFAVAPMRQLYQLIADHYEPGETIVIGGGLAFGARIAQEKLGIPMASLPLEPDKFRSLYETAMMPPHMGISQWQPRWLKRTIFTIADRLVVDPFLSPLTKFRSELGLPAVTSYLHQWWHSSQLAIGLFPDWWAAPQPDWPRQAITSGFPLWDQNPSGDLPENIARFIDAGEPPVVFTMVSVYHRARRFFNVAAKLCRRQRLRALFLAAYPELLPDDLPDRVETFHYAPFSVLLPLVAAVVHHGGIGTAAQCLAAGVPQIAVPPTHVHRNTGHRLQKLGVGKVLYPYRCSTAALANALHNLLNSSEVTTRCQLLANQIQQTDPLTQICDLLEKLVGTDGQQNLVLQHQL